MAKRSLQCLQGTTSRYCTGVPLTRAALEMAGSLGSSSATSTKIALKALSRSSAAALPSTSDISDVSLACSTSMRNDTHVELLPSTKRTLQSTAPRATPGRHTTLKLASCPIPLRTRSRAAETWLVVVSMALAVMGSKTLNTRTGSS